MKQKLFAIALAAGLAHFSGSAFAQQGASTARITQEGSNGIATINQLDNFSGHFAEITQLSGDANRAVINQSQLGAPDVFTGTSAGITQGGGNMNVAYLDLHVDGNAAARIEQDGSGNQSTITIANSTLVGAVNTQAGTNNVGLLNQQGGYRTEASLDQVGLRNFGSIYQHSATLSTVIATQAGDFNVTDIDQFGVGEVETHQIGNWNTLGVMQAGGIIQINTVKITQASNRNTANVTQNGDGFSAVIVQSGGDGNTATINQRFH